MYCFIFDYKDATGKDFHQGFRSTPLFVGTLYDAAQAIKYKLESQGYIISAIAHIQGFHSLEDLERMAIKPTEIEETLTRLIYVNLDAVDVSTDLKQ